MLLYVGQREGGRKVGEGKNEEEILKTVSHGWKGQRRMKYLFFSHLFCGTYESCGSSWFLNGLSLL